MVEESGLRMFPVWSKIGFANVPRMVVENSPDSHKPVENQRFTASERSRTRRIPRQRGKAADGPLRGPKRESLACLAVCGSPFSLALHCVGSVLAVKGSLRRFAPWTAPGRSERRAAYEGKGGVRAVGCGGRVASPLAHDKGYYHSCLGRSRKLAFGHTRRLEPQPRGAVTRRAAARRRSRASGLTRLSA